MLIAMCGLNVGHAPKNIVTNIQSENGISKIFKIAAIALKMPLCLTYSCNDFNRINKPNIKGSTSHI
jgi:hypothetical protein